MTGTRSRPGCQYIVNGTVRPPATSASSADAGHETTSCPAAANRAERIELRRVRRNDEALKLAQQSTSMSW